MGQYIFFGFLTAGCSAYYLSKYWKNKWMILVSSLVGIVICFVCLSGWASLVYFLSGADSAKGYVLEVVIGVFWGAVITLPCAWFGWKSGKKTDKPRPYSAPTPGAFDNLKPK
jgi:biotin transporter BioY